MIRKFWMAAALVLGGWALPAQATDVASLDCVIKEMPAAAHDVVVEVGRRSALGQDGEPEGLDGALGGFRKAVATCTSRYHWNDAAAAAAGKYTIAVFVLEGVSEVAATKGVDLAVVEHAVAQLTEEQRVALRDGSDTESGEAWDALTDVLVKDGHSFDGEEQYGMIGGILGAALTRDQCRADFIAS